MIHRRLFFVVIATYLALSLLYSLMTPPFEASDELWHYPFVKVLADNSLQLPLQDPSNPQPWRQEGSQPPLYYMIAAVLTAGIDTSDMDLVRRVNPHGDLGLAQPDGNANMIVHRADLEAFPWRGTILALYMSRFFSIVLGLGTILVTYHLTREVFPAFPVLAVGAMALNAFLPMFLFISAVVNNDNLSNFLGNLLVLLIVRVLKQHTEPSWRDYILIGIVTGTGLLAKLSIGALIPIVALALVIVSLRQRSIRALLVGGLISGALTIAIAGWWYWRNYQLYGDPSGLNVFLEFVGRRAMPATLTQLWSERNGFLQAYWGFFGGVNVPMSQEVYLVFNLIGGIALLSTAIFIIAQIIRFARKDVTAESSSLQIQFWLPVLVTLLWPAITFISYLRWTSDTLASQGRLVFVALSAISMWMAVGLYWSWHGRWRIVPLTGAIGYFAAVAAVAPFIYITPAYAPPPPIPASPSEYTFSSPEAGRVGLMASRILTESVQPNTFASIELDWRVIEPFEHNWSMFIHLLTPDGVIVAQRDVFPGQGRLATSDLEAGRTWRNLVMIWIPPGVYAPQTLQVTLGWYNILTGERMTYNGDQQILSLGEIAVMPRESNLNVPNPLSVNFSDTIELLGYAYSDLSPDAGSEMTVTLYWRALRVIDQDYTVFVHIIHPATTAIYASSDAQPAAWTRPTTTWQPGEIIEDSHTFTVNVDTPPAIYEVEIGLYRQMSDGTFPRLRVLAVDGGDSTDFVYLNRVRINPSEAE